jgi:hypothetical protein
MAEDTRTKLGKFLSERYKNFDTPNDPFKPLTESFVNIDLPDADLRLRELSSPTAQKVGEFPHSRTPALPIKIDELPKTQPAASQPSPTIPHTRPAGLQPALPC